MISIIIPIYKVEKYLNQCVDSVLGQTYKNLEIILVDDGSPDNCPQICDEYAKSDSRVKVVHKKNGGLMSARQAGLKEANGEYIGFVDGDDWIDLDMYENFVKVIERYNPDIALCEFYFSYPNEEKKSTQNLSKPYFNKVEAEKEIYPTMLFKDKFYSFGINPCCWSKVVKREILEKNLYSVTPKIKIGEDSAFTYPCLLDADGIAYIDKALYHYRINPQSMTKSYDEKLEDTILIPYEILKKVFLKYDTDGRYNLSKQLQYYLIYLVNGVVRNEANSQNKKSSKEKKATLEKFAENEDVISATKNIDYSRLPFHTKVMAKFISCKNCNLLLVYTRLLKRFLK